MSLYDEIMEEVQEGTIPPKEAEDLQKKRMFDYGPQFNEKYGTKEEPPIDKK